MVFNAPFNNISVSFIGGENWRTRSRCLEENPVFLFLSKKINNEKEEFSPNLQVVFSIVDRSQFEI